MATHDAKVAAPIPIVQQLNASLLRTTLLPTDRQAPVPAGDDPVRRNQSCTTSHMLVADWSQEHGWAAPEIVPYENFSLPPTASVLHYGTECFEGMKIYRGVDGRARLFRPELNCRRLRGSSLRGGLPDFDPGELQKLILAFLAVDSKRWLPEPGTFLYVRPALIGTSAALGVSRPSEARLFVVSVLFPQFGQAGPGLKLLCSDVQVRAWPGGFGNAKLGANYAPTLVAQEEANKQGFIQVLWLFGPEHHITEAGACNFFAVIRNAQTGRPEVITPPLGDIILDGVTRKSVLELAKERLADGQKYVTETGLQAVDVVERQLPVAELLQSSKDGRLLEVFVTGTAFFVAPVRMVRYGSTDIEIGERDADDRVVARYSATLKGWLSDIMYGREEHGWGHVIPEE